SLKLCIRVLFHVNTTKKQIEMNPVYLREAKKLRPDQLGDQQ
ncbi:MAG: chorismate mutase, partial [Candidatus Margulisbacteria bacterium]|nr:chorismate mutase [Candidatus Margulisiibacteriota bacterium]